MAFHHQRGDWKMEVLPDGHAVCRFRGNGSADVAGTSNVVTGSWVEITCARSTARGQEAL
jgi:hypothetical protein